MAVLAIKYYTYQDEHGTQISEEQCTQMLYDILKRNSRKSLIKILSDAAMNIKNGDNMDIILEYQKKVFNVDAEIFLCHTRAIITLFQFVFENKIFDSTKEGMAIIDVFDLFLLANTYYEFKNDKMLLDANDAFFYSFRDIHNSFSDVDSHFYYDFFKKIHDRMKLSNQLNEFNKILQERIVIDIDAYTDLLSDFTNKKNTAKLWQLLPKKFSIDYNSIDSEWDNRRFKLSIPFNYFFFLKYPIIIVDREMYITSVNTLMYSIFTLLYRELNENNPNLFKNEFGNNIAEPEMIEVLKQSFISDGAKALNLVRGGKYEYADFGFVEGNDIFLFEIKTSMLNDKNRYVEKEEFFLKNFEEKYIANEGVNQQLKRLNDLSYSFSDFIECNNNALSKNRRYNVYPILFLFDESFQSFECNNYIKKRFGELKTANQYSFSEFDLGCNDSVVTVNEIQFLNLKFQTSMNRINLLKEYTQVIDGVSFNIFLNSKQSNIKEEQYEQAH